MNYNWLKTQQHKFQQVQESFFVSSTCLDRASRFSFSKVVYVAGHLYMFAFYHVEHYVVNDIMSRYSK